MCITESNTKEKERRTVGEQIKKKERESEKEKKGRKEGGREEKKPARKKAFRTGLVLELCFHSLII